jgi:hypothetical protein
MEGSSNKWFYLALFLSFAFFGLQYMRYIGNRELMAQKEAKLRIKMQAKAQRKEDKVREVEALKSERRK